MSEAGGYGQTTRSSISYNFFHFYCDILHKQITNFSQMVEVLTERDGGPDYLH